MDAADILIVDDQDDIRLLIGGLLTDEGHGTREAANAQTALAMIADKQPDIVVLGLGANDMLRGLPPDACEENLRGIVQKARAAGADVLLLGMKANPTLGPDYVAKFDAIYPALAAELIMAGREPSDLGFGADSTLPVTEILVGQA
jgi:lysophospholipase L1-like esterase